MTLLAPLALALGLLAAPIVLMYMLKLRRREYEISSTFLWRRALDDIQANTPWQRLRPSLLLLLQLLAVAALVFALARPAYTQTRTFNGDLIVILDQSYGMQFTDAAPSRFAVARTMVQRLAAELSGGYVMSVIGMSSEPQLLIAQSDDQQAITHTLDHLRATVSAPNFPPALSLAASLVRVGAGPSAHPERTRLVIVTSRDSGISRLPILVPFPVQIVRVGGRARDLGITAFHAAGNNGKTEAILRVKNFGTRTAQSDLDLYVGSQLADVRPLTVAPGQEQDIFWTHLPPTTEQLRASLAVMDDVGFDKSAWALSRTGSVRRVLLVSKGDYFLETALALDSSMQIAEIPPAAYRAAMAAGYDMVVFEGFLPSHLPATPTLIVAPPQTSAGSLTFGPERSAGAVAVAPLSTGSVGSALLQYVDLSDVHVARARVVRVRSPISGEAAWLQPVAVSASLPVITAGMDGAAPVVVIPFRLQESDWPLRVSFPIAVQNLIRYLTPGPLLGATELTTGQHVAFFPGKDGVQEVDVRRPDGGIDRVRAPFPPFADTAEPGVYTASEVGGSGRTSSFVVNFLPSRPAPVAGPRVLRFGEPAGGGSRAVGVPVSIAWPFGLMAVLILTVEWWFAFRR